jgi:hypothetical protein
MSSIPDNSIPDNEALCGYLLGDVSAAERAAIEQAAAASSDVRSRLERLRGTLEGVRRAGKTDEAFRVEPSRLAMLKRIADPAGATPSTHADGLRSVVRMVFDSASAGPAVGFRGVSAARVRRFEFVSGEVDIRTAPDPERDGRYMIQGGAARFAGGRVRAECADGSAVESDVDASGYFELFVSAGVYTVGLTADGVSIAIEGLSVGE